MRFNPPPNWPAPPRGWEPGPQWRPDPAWGPPPQGWRLWVSEAPPAPRLQPEPIPSIQASVVPSRSNATSRLAIAAMILAVLLPPVGLVVGLAARRQIRRTHEAGANLAKAAIILGSVLLAAYVIGGLVALATTLL